MQAVRFVGVGKDAQIEDVAKPSPGAGQVLIKIGGAGVCHSDLHVMEEDLGFTPPFTLGHENAGWVAELGEGVTGFKEGDAVAVYGPWGCGRCHSCQLSMENYKLFQNSIDAQHNASQHAKRFITMKSTLVSDYQSSTIVEPRKAPLNAPPLGIARSGKARRLTTFSTVFIFSGRNTSFDSAPRQLAPEGSTVKTFVGDQFRHSGSGSSAPLFLDGDGSHCSARQTNFVRLRALAEQANRQTVAVSDQHHFTAFANLGAPNSIAPFLDGTKEPSRKAAAHSILPARSSDASSVCQTISQTPACDHSSNRRQHVVGEPYSLGKSAHATPVFKIYRMPFKHLRLSVRGRPRPGLCCGKSGSITCHCTSVKSCRLIMPTILTQIK